MAEHGVKFTIPNFDCGGTGIEFRVRGDGSAFGKLRIGKGGLLWTPASNKKNAFELSWEKFNALTSKEGSRVDIRALFRKQRKLKGAARG